MKKERTELQLVTIAEVDHPHEASMLKSFLETEGISVYLQDEIVSQFYTMAVGGIKIQVSNVDAERAHQLLVEGGFMV